MYKVITLTILVVFWGTVAHTRKVNIQSSHIRRFSLPLKQDNNANDLCRDCVDTFDTLIYLILDGIIEVGIINTCDDICDYVTAKSGSPVLYAICAVGCDALGVNEFIKIAKEVDLDPIYFCESLKICPINDNGDAKFKSFSILPSHAPVYSTFVIDFAYESVNGTGTGQLVINIQTLDFIEITTTFLIESLKPGRYAERITVDASPDPTCDPGTEECEQWYPGVYNVTVMVCNGECGSHHPHNLTNLEFTATETITRNNGQINQIHYQFEEFTVKNVSLGITNKQERLTLSFDNFVPVLRPFIMGYYQHDELKQAFQVLDRDCSGSIHIDELTRFLPIINEYTTSDTLKNYIRKVDINTDGNLNYDEFRSLVLKGIGRDVICNHI
ncbi:unnamed protein product [Rotaria sp. Silwood2]|nr:unnamed protein product [Rotaria sp. Silwood2]